MTSCHKKRRLATSEIMKFLVVQGKIYAWHHVPQNDKNSLQEACKAKEEKEEKGKNEEGERKRKKQITKLIKQMRLST
jgi:hypothetical protein